MVSVQGYLMATKASIEATHSLYTIAILRPNCCFTVLNTWNVVIKTLFASCNRILSGTIHVNLDFYL